MYGRAQLVTDDPTLGDLTSSTWKNHGEYVSAQPEEAREAASASCIGMPIR